MISYELTNFVSILERAHDDNARYRYYAKLEQQNRPISTMPITPFVFEFFIYNSIYQVDWVKSIEKGVLQNHPDGSPDGFSESKCQRELEKFLKLHGRNAPQLVHQEFSPLVSLELSGGWLIINPDSRISETHGQRFFQSLKNIQGIVGAVEEPGELSVNNRLFDSIETCRYYIYLVRNNIFHGSKTLGHTYEENQRRRIEVYLLFLRSLTGLFFSTFRSFRSS